MIKKKWRTSGQELVPQGRERVLKESSTWKFSEVGLGELRNLGKLGKAGPRGQKTEKAALQPINSPRTMALARWQEMGNQEKPTETPFHRGRAWDNERGTAYKPLFRNTDLPHRGRAWGLERTHRPCSTEGGPGELKQAHERLANDAGGQDQG